MTGAMCSDTFDELIKTSSKPDTQIQPISGSAEPHSHWLTGAICSDTFDGFTETSSKQDIQIKQTQIMLNHFITDDRSNVLRYFWWIYWNIK